MKLTVHYMGYGMTACLMAGIPGRDWGVGHRWSGSWEDVTCQDCLAGKEEVQTFTVSPDGKSFTCKRCGRTSHSQKDVEHHWCGYCGVSHDDIWPPARKAWLEQPAPDLRMVVCDCGFRLGFKKSHHDEIMSGTWGTITCPQCARPLNEKIKALGSI